MNRLAQALEREIGEYIATRERHIAMGQCESMDEYRALCGEIAGFRASLTILRDISRRLRDDG